MIRLILLALLVSVGAHAQDFWAAGGGTEPTPPISNGPDELPNLPVNASFDIQLDFERGGNTATFLDARADLYYDKDCLLMSNSQINFGNSGVLPEGGLPGTVGFAFDPGQCYGTFGNRNQGSSGSPATLASQNLNGCSNQGQLLDPALVGGFSNPACNRCWFNDRLDLSGAGITDPALIGIEDIGDWTAGVPEVTLTFTRLSNTGACETPMIRVVDQRVCVATQAGPCVEDFTPPFGGNGGIVPNSITPEQLIFLPEPRYGLLFGLLGVLALGGKRHAV